MPWTKADAAKLRKAQERGADYATDADVALYNRSPEAQYFRALRRKQRIQAAFSPPTNPGPFRRR